MGRPSRFSPEVRERAVRMVEEHQEAHPYVVEGIGEDIFPSTMDFSVLDDVIQMTDRDCFVTTRRLVRQEGIFAGGSSGGAVWAALQTAQSLSVDDYVVVFIPDTGRQYLSKVYNDEWMRENRYLEPAVRLTAGECVPHPVSWTHVCATRHGVARIARALRVACDTPAFRGASTGCSVRRTQRRRRARRRGCERPGRRSLAP